MTSEQYESINKEQARNKIAIITDKEVEGRDSFPPPSKNRILDKMLADKTLRNLD